MNVCVSICVWLVLSVFVHLRLFIFQLFIAHYFFRFCRSGIQNINCFSFGFPFLPFFSYLVFLPHLYFGLDKIATCNIYTCQKYCMKSKLFVLNSFAITVSISHIDIHMYVYRYIFIYMYIHTIHSFGFFCLCRLQMYVNLNVIYLLLLANL